jgi:NitT/TauT family transport system ATP-binding protein
MTTIHVPRTGSAPGATSDAIGRVVVDHVTHQFNTETPTPLTVLDDVSFTVENGQFVAIVGASGCGKTTMLNLIAGLVTGQAGELSVSGHTPQPGHPDVAYLFARDSLLPWRTVAGNVELGMEIRGLGKKERAARALDYLERVGLGAYAQAYPAQLSHGMRQRVALARTIAQQPKIILLDEPFSALDAQTKILLQGVFVDLWEDIKSTVILITHDLGEAITLANRVLLFSSRPGRVKTDVDVPLVRPRKPLDLQSDPMYHDLYERIWQDLREEVD